MTAPKVSSSGKAEQYVIPSVIEQLRGLSMSFVVVRNVLYNACRSGWRWGCPVVGQLELAFLWIWELGPQVVAG